MRGARRSRNYTEAGAETTEEEGHEEPMLGDKVRMTFRVVLSRQQAEVLATRAIQEEKNLETLVAEILEAATGKGKA